jgi:hypothetical protein
VQLDPEAVARVPWSKLCFVDLSELEDPLSAISLLSASKNLTAVRFTIKDSDDESDEEERGFSRYSHKKIAPEMDLCQAVSFSLKQLRAVCITHSHDWWYELLSLPSLHTLLLRWCATFADPLLLSPLADSGRRRFEVQEWHRNVNDNNTDGKTPFRLVRFKEQAKRERGEGSLSLDFVCLDHREFDDTLAEARFSQLKNESHLEKISVELTALTHLDSKLPFCSSLRSFSLELDLDSLSSDDDSKISSSTWQNIAAFCKACPKLRSLDLDTVLASPGQNPLLDVLPSLSSLRSLSLAGLLTADSLGIVEPCLKHLPLLHLGVFVDSSSLKPFAALLLTCPSLTSLHLSTSSSEEESIDYQPLFTTLRLLPSLSTFSLNPHQDYTDECINSLLSTLKNSPQQQQSSSRIERIQLNGLLSVPQLQLIAEALPSLTSSLKHLSLPSLEESDSKTFNKALSTFFSNLPQTSLTSLYFQSLEMMTHTFETYVESVSRTKLTCFSIGSLLLYERRDTIDRRPNSWLNWDYFFPKKSKRFCVFSFHRYRPY